MCLCLCLCLCLHRFQLFVTRWTVACLFLPPMYMARILEWVAISFSRESSWPRDGTPVSDIVGRFITIWATREAYLYCSAHWNISVKNSVQFSHSVVAHLCHPMDRSTSGLPVHHQLQEFTQTHLHWISDAIEPSNPLSSASPPTINLSQYQGLFKWVSSSH